MGKLLHQAVKSKNFVDVKKYIRTEGVNDKDEYQQTALHLACLADNLDIVKLLLRKKANVNTTDRNGWTAFHFAASEGQIAIFHELLSNVDDVDVGILTKDGTSALHYIARNTPKTKEEQNLYSNAIRLYIERNGDVNSQSKHGESALHQACPRGNMFAAKCLLKHKAKVDILNKIGETPLHYAARADQLEIVKLLLKNNANPSLKVGDGEIHCSANIIALLNSQNETPSPDDTGKSVSKTTKLDVSELKLQVKILKASNLTPVGDKDNASSYCQLVFNKQRMNTSVQPKTLNPNWDETFLFDVEDLNYPLKVTLYEQRDDNAQPTKEDLLGSVTLSLNFVDIDMSGSGEPLSDWYALKRKPRRAGYKQIPKVQFEVSYVLKSSIKPSTDPSTMQTPKDDSGAVGAFGIRRGKCKLTDCDCDAYQPESARGGQCQNCGHWPAQHQNLGSSDGANASKENLISLQETTPSTPEAPPTSDNILTGLSWEINSSELTMQKRLGEGAFAQVWKGEYRSQEVAIKVLKDKPDASGLIDFKKEFDILSMIRSPHLVFFYGASTQPNFCLVFEFCSRGTLYDVLNNVEEIIDWPRVFKAALDSIKGLLCLHNWKPPIVHRDMKSLNLLVDSNWVCKVSDFGTSRATAGKSTDLATLGKLRGTYAYCAPEVYFGQNFTAKSDIFSFGVILWELAFRCITGKYEQPFSEFKNIVYDFQILIQSAKKDARPTIPANCPKPFANLVSRCWDKDPNIRPTTDEVFQQLRDLEQVYMANKREWDATCHQS